MSLPIITLEEFQSCPWREALDGISSRIHDYSSAFVQKAEEFDKTSSCWKSLRFLGAICLMILSDDENGPPFKSIKIVFDSQNSYLPEDIPNETLDALFYFSSEITNHLLRSRIMDTIWIRKTSKRVLAAKEAVNSYLKCAKELNYTPYECTPYLKRALDITYSLGNGGVELREQVCSSFSDAINKYSQGDLAGLHWSFFSILAKRKIGNPEQLFNLMVCAAAAYEAKSKFYLMRSFLELAKSFAKNSGQNKQQIQSISVQMAESYVNEATSKDHPMARAYFLGQAIQAYRTIGGFETRIDELHKQMLETQRIIPDFLTTHTFQLPDLSDITEEVRRIISGKEIFAALADFASIANLLDPEKERQNAIERAKKSVFQNFFAQRHMNEKGKTVSLSGAINSKDINTDDAAINSEMLRKSHIVIILELYAKIIPGLYCILEEHPIDESLIYDIIRNNPFVPPGHEMFFFRGIKAGFDYDFASASLFLVPQLENSLRYIMKNNGKIPSSLTSTGVQPERYLNDLLGDPFIEEYFGKEYIFTFKALLTEQVGANLRHKIAHGLADYDFLQGYAAVYFWWLMLRLLLLPNIRQQKEEEKENM